MEAQFQKIKKWFQETSMKSTSYEKRGIKPSHDWMILLMVTIIMTGIVGGGAYYLYMRIDENTLFPIQEDTIATEETINTALLQKTINWIDAKATTTSQLERDKTTPSDPSL